MFSPGGRDSVFVQRRLVQCSPSVSTTRASTATLPWISWPWSRSFCVPSGAGSESRASGGTSRGAGPASAGSASAAGGAGTTGSPSSASRT